MLGPIRRRTERIGGPGRLRGRQRGYGVLLQPAPEQRSQAALPEHPRGAPLLDRVQDPAQLTEAAADPRRSDRAQDEATGSEAGGRYASTGDLSTASTHEPGSRSGASSEGSPLQRKAKGRAGPARRPDTAVEESGI